MKARSLGWVLALVLVAVGAWWAFHGDKASESTDASGDVPGHTSIRRLPGAERARRLADGPKETGPADVRGVVVTDEGAPVENAQVSLWHRDTGSARPPTDGKLTRGEAARLPVLSRYSLMTDKDGAFHVEKIPAGTYSLLAAGDGFLPGEVTLVTLAAGPNGPLRYVLRTGLSVRGRVTDESGQPVAEVRVSARPELRALPVFDPVSAGEVGQPQHFEAITHADGTFVLKVMRAGAYSLRLHPPETFVPLEQVVKAPVEGLELHLQHGGRVEGVVLDAQRTPVVRASVGVTAKNDAGKPAVLNTAITDAQGHFTLHGVPNGTVEIGAAQVAVDTKLHRSVKKSVTVSNHQAPFMELVLGGAGHVTGMVVDGSKHPLAGAQVNAKGSEAEQEAITDAAGKFSLEVPAGKYQVTASLSGYHGSFDGVSAEADGAAVTLTLARAATIRGHISTWDHQPLQGFTVNGRTISDATGNFQVERRASLDSVTVAATGYAPLTRALGKAEEDGPGPPADVDLGELVLGAGHTVSGVVVDATTNQPVAGATVKVVSEGTPGSNLDFAVHRTNTAGQARTDAQGRYTLQVDDGAAYLQASDGTHRPAVQSIASGQQIADFRLEQGAAVVGTVRGVDGAPIGGAHVVAVAAGTSASGGHATADEAGHFEIGGLAAGDYTVSAVSTESISAGDMGGQRVHVPASGSVSVDLGPTGKTTLDIHVSGGTGAPVFVVVVEGDTASPSAMRNVTCQPGASCPLKGVAAGPHTLLVSQAGDAGVQVEVDVQASGTQVVNVPLR